jgi:bifunctional non-homologous end joining protein LigD
VIAKRADGPYRAGPRASGDWIKIKCDQEDDFVVVGYVRGQGSRTLGALDLASYEGTRLLSRGKVGSGFDEATLALLLRTLSPLHSEVCAAEGELVAAPRGRMFVRPELVVNVRHAGFTREGHLRHPVFRGLRADVAASECTAAPRAERAELLERAPQVVEASESVAPVQRGRARITNPQKVYWPDDGYTKVDLCAYYEAIAPAVLPFLRDRPVILVRYPDGIAGKSFYQWNAPKDTPSWVRTIRVRWDERDGKDVDLFLINDVDTLVYIANLGCIPLHILAARVGALAECDFLTIDFDLNGQSLPDAITLARELHGLLEKLTLQGFPKTSGQTGLHVLVPLGQRVPFDTARTLAELLGRLLVARHPQLATMERIKAKRGPRVYVDTGQTGTIRAIVAPYSVRAYRGARVSTPLTWDEVGFALDPGRFTIASVPARVAQFGCPMAGLLSAAPDLARSIEALSRLLPQR